MMLNNYNHYYNNTIHKCSAEFCCIYYSKFIWNGKKKYMRVRILGFYESLYIESLILMVSKLDSILFIKMKYLYDVSYDFLVWTASGRY